MAKGEVQWVAKAKYGACWYAFDGRMWHAESSEDAHDDFAGVLTDLTNDFREDYRPAFGVPGTWVAQRLFEQIPPDDTKFRELAGEQPVAAAN